MSAKQHYDDHLGNFYSWMTGDFEINQQAHQQFLQEQNIIPISTGYAIDAGAGHGIQSVSLAKLGFAVKAIDFNRQLLTELKRNSNGFNIEIIDDDIRSVSKYAHPKPELIVCWGDTLSHLESEYEIEQFLSGCCRALATNGKLILSFRDYSNELTGDSRFIPVKNDDNRILTCFLEYHAGSVTDLLYEKETTGWKLKVSSYNKVRISPPTIKNLFTTLGMTIIFDGWRAG